MTILFSVPRGILLTSYLGPKSKEKSVLPGIWIGSWLFIPKDRNDYWLVLINDLALLMLPFVCTSPISNPLKKGKEKSNNSLASVAQLVGRRTANREVESSITSQVTCLSCWLGPQSGCIQEATNQSIKVSLSHQCFFPSLSPSLPLSLEAMKEKTI